MPGRETKQLTHLSKHVRGKAGVRCSGFGVSWCCSDVLRISDSLRFLVLFRPSSNSEGARSDADGYA